MCESQGSLTEAVCENGSASLLLAIGSGEPLNLNTYRAACRRPYDDVDPVVAAQRGDAGRAGSLGRYLAGTIGSHPLGMEGWDALAGS